MRPFGFLKPAIAEQHRAAGLPAQSSGPGHSRLLPASHSHPNRAKQLLSLPGQAQGLPQAGLSELWPKAHVQWLEAEMLSASEVLDGVTDPAPLNRLTRQAEQQAPTIPGSEKRGAAGSHLP